MKRVARLFSLKSWLWLSKRLVLGGLLVFITCWWIIPCFFSAPDLENVRPQESLIILDRNGEALHHATREDYVRHRHTPLEEIPEQLIQATLAAEDKRFWNHGGIDMLATLRSLKDALSAGRVVSGASTISQQTVKLSKERRKRTLANKITEAFEARKLEMSSSKQEILELYFNIIEYGNRTQGPHQAARHYFNKPLSQLSLAEYALLAGLPQAPSRHNPRRDPEGAIERRNWVLERMRQTYAISDDSIERAKAEPLQLSKGSEEYRSNEIAELLADGRSGTLQTSLSKPLQDAVQSIVQRELHKLREQNVNNAAVVVIDNSSGEILALVGNSGGSDALGTEFNAALLPRSPGSALKPFAYLLGFEEMGYSPATIIPDVPTYYAGTRGPEEIVNYDRKHHGPVTIQYALGNSLNIPAVRVLNQAGGPSRFKEFLQGFGFSTLHKEASEYGLGLSIGAGEIALLEIANAYSTIARLGSYQKASLTGQEHQSVQVASPEQCYLIADILSNNRARSMTFGSDSHLRLPFPCAAKTGTSTDYKDNFCVGFTKQYTVGVWVGNLDNTPMQEVSGVSGAGPIFHQTMLKLHESVAPSWIEAPSGIQITHVDPHTGKGLPAGHPRYPIAEEVKLLHLVEEARESDYHHSKPILDQRYMKWIAEHKTQFALIDTTTRHAPAESLRILSPTKGATYYLDPDLPNSGSKLSLQANIENIDWSSETLSIEKDKAHLTEGVHFIEAKDQASGRISRIEIKVERL